MTSPTILIFEPDATGHHSVYLRHLLNGIAPTIKDPTVILLTSQDAAQHEGFQRLLADFGALLQIRTVAPAPGKTGFGRLIPDFYWRQWKGAKMLAQGIDDLGSNRIDCILLPHLESIGLLPLALRPAILRGHRWLAVTNATKFHHRQAGIDGPYRWQDGIQRWLFAKILRQPNLIRMFVVDPFLVPLLHHSKLAWAPDPVIPPQLTDPLAARRAYGLRAETFVILVFGFISQRKCVDALLKGVARLGPDLDVTVFLAGSQHGRHREAMANSEVAARLREQGRLVELDRYIVDGEDADPMATADICWVVYDRTWMMPSGVLLLAGLSQRAVICRRRGVIGRLVAQYQCGLTLESDEPDRVAEAITILVRDPVLRKRMGSNGYDAFVHQTPERFAQPIIDDIAVSLAAP